MEGETIGKEKAKNSVKEIGNLKELWNIKEEAWKTGKMDENKTCTLERIKGETVG